MLLLLLQGNTKRDRGNLPESSDDWRETELKLESADTLQQKVWMRLLGTHRRRHTTPCSDSPNSSCLQQYFDHDSARGEQQDNCSGDQRRIGVHGLRRYAFGNGTEASEAATVSVRSLLSHVTPTFMDAGSPTLSKLSGVAITNSHSL